MAGRVVRCIYNFPAETETDLDIKIGDVIKITKEINAEWYEGQLHNRNGQFPAAYVEECNEVFDIAVATRAFKGDQDGDLTFENGDYLVITEIIDDNWMRGYVQGGGYGMFPRAFVKEISLDPSEIGDIIQKTPPDHVENDYSDKIEDKKQFTGNEMELEEGSATVTKSQNTDEDSSSNKEEDNWVTVLENFSAMDTTELNLVAGTKVKIVCEVDDFWCKGILHNGEEGIFPRNFVDLPESPKIVEENIPEKVNENVNENVINNVIEISESDAEIETSHSTDEVLSSFCESETVIMEGQNSEVPDHDLFIGKTTALFNFSGTEKGDLSFNQGEEIMLLEIVNESWMKGKIKEHVGIFPSNYVNSPEMFEIIKSEIEVSKNCEISDTSESIVESQTSPVNVCLQTNLSKESELNKSVDSIKDVIVTQEATGSPKVSPKKKAPPKPGKPKRPKLPELKKNQDELNPFAYFDFKTKSKPIVIIPSKYRKPGFSNILLLKTWTREEIKNLQT